MSDVKLCKDCRWSRWSLQDRLLIPFSRERFSVCVQPDVRSAGIGEFCQLQRDPRYDVVGLPCGPDAKLWEAIPRIAIRVKAADNLPRRWWQFWRRK